MIDDTEVPPLAERRQKRHKSFLGGIVVHSEGRFSFACLIRDLSDTGARISFHRAQPLPEFLYLLDKRHRTAYRANVTWANDHEAGLRFLSRCSLDAPTGDCPGFVRRLAG